jgi:hypothetical protein
MHHYKTIHTTPCGPDLTIAEMLSDSIVQALMEADGIDAEILEAQLRGIAQEISTARREDKNG